MDRLPDGSVAMPGRSAEKDFAMAEAEDRQEGRNDYDTHGGEYEGLGQTGEDLAEHDDAEDAA